MKNDGIKTSLQFDKEKRKRKKTYATFITAFLCFSLVLAAVSFLILLKKYNFRLSNIVDRKTTATTEETSTEGETYLQNYTGNANILVLCENSDNKLGFFGVLNFNMDAKQISVTSFENDVNLKYDGKSGTFSDIYSTGGALGLSQAVEKCCGIKIDRFIDVTETNFKRVISYLGDAEIYSDEKINFKGGDYVLILEEGEQSATGETVLSYFKYLDAKGRSVLTAELLDYYMNSGKLKANQETFDSVINLFNTNISVKDYNDVSDTFNAFLNDSSRRKTVVSETPEVTDNG
ncbi:MAG: LCP family protein [Clostridiales bacterium]|nr:LCP family protein [Clostridiales bacterium]